MKKGKGLLEQIDESNVTTYTHLTLEELEKSIRQLSRTGLKRKRNKLTGKYEKGYEHMNIYNPVFMMGEGARQMFDDAMKEQSLKYSNNNEKETLNKKP